MNHRLTHALLTLSLGVALSPLAAAQCAGQGDLRFEFISDPVHGTAPGSPLTLRIIGKPFEHICLACDVGDGPVNLFGFATVCLDFGPNLVEFIFPLPASGIAEFHTTVPEGIPFTELCCLVLGLDTTAPNNLAVSNLVCFELDEPCDSGGLSGVGAVTEIQNVASFPVQLTARATGRAGGGGSSQILVNFDPNNPPAFPIDSGNGFQIEKLARNGSSVFVWLRVDADEDGLSHNQNGRLPNEVTFSVTASSDVDAQEIHVSCSQPIAVGLVFDEYTITSVTDRH